MGGFLGIGKSGAEKQLEQQRRLAAEEAEAARREAEITLAEKAASSKKQIANVQIGIDSNEFMQEAKPEKDVNKLSLPDQALGLGGIAKKKTKAGVQI